MKEIKRVPVFLKHSVVLYNVHFLYLVCNFFSLQLLCCVKRYKKYIKCYSVSNV